MSDRSYLEEISIRNLGIIDTSSLELSRGLNVLTGETGAGKTMTSCYLFSQLKVSPVVFVVPALELLKQTKNEFEKYLRLDDSSVKVGIAGGGLCFPRFSINYTYETTISTLTNATGGAHEIGMSFRFGNKKEYGDKGSLSF